MPARPKAELLGIIERIVKMYHDDKMEIRDIETVLRDENIDISRGSIHRTLQNHKKVAQDYKKSLQEAQVLMETVRDHPNTDVLETANSLIASKFLEFTKTIETLDFDDPVEFIKALSSLTRSQVQVGKLRMDYQNGFDAAKRKIMKGLGDALRDKPELLAQLRAIADAIVPDK